LAQMENIFGQFEKIFSREIRKFIRHIRKTPERRNIWAMPSGLNAVSISVRIWRFLTSVIAFIRSVQPSIRRTSYLILIISVNFLIYYVCYSYARISSAFSFLVYLLILDFLILSFAPSPNLCRFIFVFRSSLLVPHVLAFWFLQFHLFCMVSTMSAPMRSWIIDSIVPEVVQIRWLVSSACRETRCEHYSTDIQIRWGDEFIVFGELYDPFDRLFFHGIRVWFEPSSKLPSHHYHGFVGFQDVHLCKQIILKFNLSLIGNINYFIDNFQHSLQR
jgi:hypothetical protein